ncbi:hypothetical protein AB0B89_31040 [Sphaerisporangium sp. NPDC049002]|uniref:hypothetical protein n=1 Tax=Sphaerisporangium sp. NPDC049002 TaxID=3155392 RepID=UPI0033F1DF3D
MTRDEQAVRLIVSAVLADILAKADRADRDQVRTTWVVGDRLNGVVADHPAGAIQVKKGAVRATVTDQAAFAEWVKTHRADELETVRTTRVRPAYVSAVLTAAKKTGTAVTADGEEIPGITVVAGEPTVAVTLADDAADLVSAAWQSGELWELIGGLLPALEPADKDGAE